jgi:multimeric flavodoxin WrbA
MNATIISDEDFHTKTYQTLEALVCTRLRKKGFRLEHRRIGRKDLTYCKGCFGCWVQKPGECLMKDGMGELNRACMNSDVVVYLSPVVFGQFSANIKNAVDRWLPNMLPFFETRPDGSTIHPPRYEDYPKQIIIGYGDNLSEEDEKLFVDITKKHRTNVDCLVMKSEGSNVSEALDEIKLERVGGML